MIVNNAENAVHFLGSGRVFSRCGIRENIDGMRDLTKSQCGIRENVDGIRDLTKRQCGIRENVDGCGI